MMGDIHSYFFTFKCGWKEFRYLKNINHLMDRLNGLSPYFSNTLLHLSFVYCYQLSICIYEFPFDFDTSNDLFLDFNWRKRDLKF